MTGGPDPRIQSEHAFQTMVINLALYNHWRVYHPPDNRPAGRRQRVQNVVPGFPDLTLVRDSRLIFAELKTAKGRVAHEQTQWLLALSSTPAEVYVWRPADWPTIEHTLARTS